MKNPMYTLAAMLVVLFGFSGQLLAVEDPKLPPSDQAGPSVKWSGGADLRWVYQDSVYGESSAFTVNGFAGADSTTFGYVRGWVGADATFDANTSLKVKVENREDTRMGGLNNLPLRFEEASLTAKNFFTTDLTLNFGVIQADINGPFFVQANYSESAWSGKNSAVPVRASLAASAWMEPFGLSFNYKQPQWSLDFLWATVVENGGTTFDENIAGLKFTFNLPDTIGRNSSVNLSYTMFKNGVAGGFVSGDEQDIRTIGFGFNIGSLGAMPALSIHGDYYQQSGDAGRTSATTTLDAGGKAWRLGVVWQDAAMANKPWLSLAYWSISGDDNSTDSDEDRFFSYENVGRDNGGFLIMEDHEFGLDVDNNYKSIRLGLGVSADKVKLSLMYGMFTALEDTPAIGSAALTGGRTRDDGLGSELDLKLTYEYSAALKFDFVLAMLQSADALNNYTFDQDDKIRMFMFGTTLSF